MNLLNYADSDSESVSSEPVVLPASVDRLGKRRRTDDAEVETVTQSAARQEAEEGLQPGLTKK